MKHAVSSGTHMHYNTFLAVDTVFLHILRTAFHEFGLQTEQNAAVLTVAELRAILSKVFQLAQRGRASFIDPDKCTEITLNWTLKCLDRYEKL